MVSWLNDVGQAIQPIAFIVKAFVLMLSIRSCDNNELPVLHSIFDHRAEYHEGLSAAFIAI